jgi:hypothetical protein
MELCDVLLRCHNIAEQIADSFKVGYQATAPINSDPAIALNVKVTYHNCAVTEIILTSFMSSLHSSAPSGSNFVQRNMDSMIIDTLTI